MIAGKGHEQGQEFADGRKMPFDDVSVAREALRAEASTATANAPAARCPRRRRRSGRMREWDAARVAQAAGAG